MAEEGIGARVLRKEDRRFLTGRGRYVGDLIPPDALRAVFLRSPHAHAGLTVEDVDEARRGPGVAGVFTGRDLADGGLGPLPVQWTIANADGGALFKPPMTALATDTVRFVGHPYAVAIADSEAAAREAAERVVAAFDERNAPTRRWSQAGGGRAGGRVARTPRQHEPPLDQRRPGGDRGRLRAGRACRRPRPAQPQDRGDAGGAPASPWRATTPGFEPPDPGDGLPASPRAAACAGGDVRPAGNEAGRRRARHRRRLRHEVLRLSRGRDAPVGGPQARARHRLGGRPDGGVPGRRRSARPHRPRRTRARRRTPFPGAARDADSQHGGLPQPARARRADDLLHVRVAGGPTASAPPSPRSARCSPTPRRSTPIAAPGVRRRSTSPNG